jgi:AcrR family transcriptional regulator
MPNRNSDSGGRDPRQGGRGDATLERLIDGAQSTFAERGYAAANIHEICARAKVGIGTFYAHFEHKRELLQQVMVERAPLLADQLSPEDLVDESRLTARLRASLSDVNETGLWRAWHQAVLEEPEVAQFHSRWRAESLGRLAELIEKARAGVTVPADDRQIEPAVIAWIMLTLARELAIQDRVGAPDVKALAQVMVRLVLGH